MNTSQKLDFDRTQHLISPEFLATKKVTVAGLGSGGFPCCQHLTMNGLQNFDLYDPDDLQPENLVKHPAQRQDLGKCKAHIGKEWIEDRNPEAKVNAFTEDVMNSSNFLESLQNSDLVLSCTDKKSVREFISDQCVAAKVPFVTASVFRTGIGGEIFSYIPGETGCYKCLQLYSEMNNLNLSDDALGLTQEEENRIYGLGEKEYRASGLSLDIQMISLIQARMALSILLRGSNTSMSLLKSNWIIFGNRPANGIFQRHFEAQQMLLRPQSVCYCSNCS